METWKQVVGYEGLYEVSDMGNVRDSEGNVLKRIKTRNGADAVPLTKGYVDRLHAVQYVVGAAFLEEYLDGYGFVCKIDQYGDYSVPNLEWKWNIDRERSSVHQIDIESRTVVNTHSSMYAAKEATGFLVGGIRKCCEGTQDEANGYWWQYYEIIIPPVKHSPQYLINQIDVDTGEIVNSFSSVYKASEVLGIRVGGINKCLSGVQMTSGGYKWEKAEEIAEDNRPTYKVDNYENKII